MKWLAWVRYRLFGGPPPRETDRDIREIRQRQHDAINELQRRGLVDEWSRRNREAWHPNGGKQR